MRMKNTREVCAKRTMARTQNTRQTDTLLLIMKELSMILVDQNNVSVYVGLYYT